MFIPKFKGAIFDLDGTILDSIPVWTKADVIFLNEQGIEYAPYIGEKMKSMHFVSAAQFFIDEFGISLSLDEVMKRIGEIVSDEYFYNVPAKLSAMRVITEIYNRGTRICVATSNKKELAEKALERLGLMDMIDFVLTCDEVGFGKENPAIYFECAEKMALNPADIMVFEDAIHGARTAKNAGFLLTGVYDLAAGDDFFEIAKFADFIVNFEDLEVEFKCQ